MVAIGFSIYLIILVIAVIIISKYSQRFSNLIRKKDPIATLATLILFSYAKNLSTVITVLSLTILEYPNGNRILWKPDATIQYLEAPKHALLFFVALIILLLGATYIVTLLFWQLLVRLPNSTMSRWIRNPKLMSLLKHTTLHTASDIRLLLLVHVVLYLTSALNTSGNTQVPLIAITLTVGGLLLIMCRNVYKSYPVNILEMIVLINLFVFTTFIWYVTDTNDTQLHNSAAYISVMITFICLLL